MKQSTVCEKLINWAAPKFFYMAFVGFFLVASQNYIAHDRSLGFVSQAFEVSFNEFSPAFAAFEDEFLFEKIDSVIPEDLKPKEESQIFEELSAVEAQISAPAQPVVTLSKSEPSDFQRMLNHFDGERAIADIQPLSTKLDLSSRANNFKAIAKSPNNEGELAFGSLVAMVGPGPHPTSNRTPSNWAAQARPSKPVSKPRPNDSEDFQSHSKEGPVPTAPADYESHGKETPDPAIIDRYIVSGGIRLKQGLAFLGSMEVSWVVGDYELQRGSINTPDATYEIEVNKLVGDIIISLYDNKDELIGEGVFDLTQVAVGSPSIVASIEILPIDWDLAGHVVHSNSLGTGINQPVEGAQVALYSFNDATESSQDGSFRFFNWKKTNSRTLAIASKEGFFDSVFMIDSKTESQVLIFENSYMNSFFEFVQSLGIYNVKDKGTVYGEIQGIGRKEGYSVRLEKAQPLYFLAAGFASIDLKTTSSNGMFSFVGLQDGDYELVVEKEGEVLDQRLVVVEQGKVSPVIVDLSKVSKHLEFFDPMEPNRNIKSVEISFFDGSSTKSLDSDNQARHKITRGQDLSLMEFQGKNEVNRTLLSRHKGLQKIPVVNDKRLLEIARSNDLSIEKGMVFGFVDSKEAYQVYLAEETVGKTIYFDESGREIEANSKKPARGFILGDFSTGLRSVIVERVSDKMILGTDLVYSNHESISITHLEILPAN